MNPGQAIPVRGAPALVYQSFIGDCITIGEWTRAIGKDGCDRNLKVREVRLFDYIFG